MPASEPEFVPVLTASDIHRGGYNGPSGTHCVLGWALRAFRGYEPLYQDLRGELSKICYEQWGYSCPADANDDTRCTKAELAKAFNQATRNLGYTEVTDA